MHCRRFVELIVVAAACSTASADKVPARPPRTYDLRNVEWHLIIHPETASIDGDVINTLRLLKPEESLDFDCGPLAVSSVAVNGAAAQSSLKGETLRVELPDRGANGIYRVEIRYSGKPTAGVYFIDGSVSYPAHTPFVYSIGTPEDNRYWLPTYDYPDNKATSEGFITVPKGWKALSNGRYLGEKTNGDQTTVHWRMDQPHCTYLISFAAGKYDIGEEKWGKLPVQYWVPEGLLPWGKATFGGTNKIIDFYSKQLGFQYPYAKFAQSTVPQFIFGGVENISAVTQSIQALFPPDEIGLDDSTGLIAHELAHQWFGDMISCSNWTHTWLSESFATLMPPFYSRSTKGDQSYERERRQIFNGAEAMRNDGPVAWDNFNYPGDVYRGQIYSGGAARLFMLIDKLGEKKFWTGIRAFLDAYKFKPATTDQFFATMSRSTRQDLTPFMEQWFYGAGVPEISVKSEGSSLVFTRGLPAVEIDPEAWIWDSGSQSWLKKKLHFTTTSSEVRFEVGSTLAKAPVMIDPEGHYLVRHTFSNSFPEDQVVAIYDRLPAFSKSVAYPWLQANQAALSRLMAEPANKPYTVDLLAQMDVTSTNHLWNLARDKRPGVRSAALRRFASLKTKLNDRVRTMLTNIAAQDPYPVIREFAYNLLMQDSNDDTMAKKAWTVDVFRDRYRIDALAWWNIHDKSTARKLCIEALDTPLSEPVQSSAIRLLGSLGDVKGERNVFDHLVKVVQSNAIILRESAIRALVAYGDPNAAKFIEPLTRSSLFIAREAAASALESLLRSR